MPASRAVPAPVVVAIASALLALATIAAAASEADGEHAATCAASTTIAAAPADAGSVGAGARASGTPYAEDQTCQWVVGGNSVDGAAAVTVAFTDFGLAAGDSVVVHAGFGSSQTLIGTYTTANMPTAPIVSTAAGAGLPAQITLTFTSASGSAGGYLDASWVVDGCDLTRIGFLDASPGWSLGVSSVYNGVTTCEHSYLVDSDPQTGCGTNSGVQYVQAVFDAPVTVFAVFVGAYEGPGGFGVRYLNGKVLQFMADGASEWSNFPGGGAVSGLAEGPVGMFPSSADGNGVVVTGIRVYGASDYLGVGTLRVQGINTTTAIDGPRGFTLSGVAGSFVDGSGAGDYSVPQQCTWWIDPSISPGGGTVAEQVILSFASLALDTNAHHAVTVSTRDPTSGAHYPVAAPTSSSVVIVPTGSAQVDFDATSGAGAAGFAAAYWVAGPGLRCPTEAPVELTAGHTFSPGITDGSGSGNYDAGDDCEWQVRASGSDTAITLAFTDFDLAPGDTVTVWSRPKISVPSSEVVVAVLTSDSKDLALAPLMASGSDPLMRVLFHTAAATPGAAGFHANVMSGTCTTGPTWYNASAGHWDDGSGPLSDYGDSVSCSWIIAPTSAEHVFFNFDRFHTESCCDFIKAWPYVVATGSKGTQTSLSGDLGSQLPQLTSDTGALWLSLTTNGPSTHFTGAAATWWAAGPGHVCRNYTLFTGYSGSGITDGSGSAAYAGGHDCTWDIRPLGGQRAITLRFDDFDLAPGDAVSVTTKADRSLGASTTFTFTSDAPPLDPVAVYGDSPSMVVTFVSADGSAGAGGFDATFHSGTCGGTTRYTAPHGTWDDGSGRGANYQANLNCWWVVEPASTDDAVTERAYIVLDRFHTESCCDRLNVYDYDLATGHSSGTTVWAGDLSLFPPSYSSSTGAISMDFTTNSGSTVYGGMTGVWWAVGPGHRCLNHTLVATNRLEPGTISDASGSGDYLPGQTCSWTLRPMSGQSAVTLAFDSFVLAAGDTLTVTTTGVRNVEAPQTTVFSSALVPLNPIVVHGGSPEVTIEFVSAESSPGAAGFEAAATLGTCYHTARFNASRGTWDDGSGPNANYAANLDCWWIFAPDDTAEATTEAVFLQLDRFHTESCCDQLNLYNYDRQTNAVTGSADVWAGDYSLFPPSYSSSTGAMALQFTTNSGGTVYGGMSGVWWAVGPGHRCLNHTLIASNSVSHGAISDASGSGDYLPGQTCSWTLRPMNGQGAVTLAFDSLVLAAGDTLTVTTTPTRTAAPPPTTTTVFSSTLAPLNPVTVFGAAPEVTVRFVSAGASPGAAGFEATSFAGTCGGAVTYRATSGYWDDGSGPWANYAPNLDCDFLLVPSEPGSTIHLQTVSFHTESCCDNLQVLEYDPSNGVTSGSVTWAGDLSGNLPSFSSTTGGIKMHFHSNGPNTQFGGASAVWWTDADNPYFAPALPVSGAIVPPLFPVAFNVTMLPPTAATYEVYLDGDAVGITGTVSATTPLPLLVRAELEVFDLGAHTLSLHLLDGGGSVLPPSLDVGFSVGYDREAVLEISDGFLNVTAGSVIIEAGE